MPNEYAIAHHPGTSQSRFQFWIRWSHPALGLGINFEVGMIWINVLFWSAAILWRATGDVR